MKKVINSFVFILLSISILKANEITYKLRRYDDNYYDKSYNSNIKYKLEKLNRFQNTIKEVKPKKIGKHKKIILNDKYRKSEIRIIYLMLNNKEVIRKYEKNLGFLPSDDMKKLANEIVYFKEINGGWDYADFITYVMNRPWLKGSLDIVLNTEQSEEYSKEELEDYFTTIKKFEVEKQINKLTNKMKETLDIEEKIKIAKRIENIKKDVLEW